MVLRIVGKIISSGGDSRRVVMRIAEHRGLFKTDGRITLDFDAKAAQDLFKHLGITDAIGLPQKVNMKNIEIDIK